MVMFMLFVMVLKQPFHKEIMLNLGRMLENITFKGKVEFPQGVKFFLNLLRREGEGYYHMEANRAWEYFKKGILIGCKI